MKDEPHVSGRNMTRCVLLVDDYKPWCESLTSLLEKFQYDVVCTSNGREALAHLRNGLHPCLILLELALPGKDGWRFQETLKKDQALCSIPVIVVTGAAEAGQAIAPSGIPAFLKPVDTQRLLDAIEHHAGAALRDNGGATTPHASFG